MAWLRIASDVADFLRRPVGAGVLVETNFLWCATPTLVGSIGWGSPSGEQVERVMTVCNCIFHASLGPQVDVLLDGSRMHHVHPAVAMAIFEWTRDNLDRLKQRIRRQVGVAPPSVGGFLLAGLLPMLGDTYRFEIVATTVDAYRSLLGSDGDSLREEVAAHVDRFSGTPPFVGELRNLLRAHKGDLTLEQAARLMARSPRSLQRELEDAGSSFRGEQMDARLQAVMELLVSSDDKIAAIATRVGMSANGLSRLIRERMGTTLDGLRRRLRRG